ncbi:hypothetical protein [Streptomyces pactum]|uniref:Uncharacterized protein n=1 Tax=Streptomyces pactum TaxID=68249 RepID=A0A1S6J2F3_9ACTN|nr:hypothetical protein [Streptomyces pactum]AQS65919.1 hypothetical protein B1H29_02290 [Streptomyces pactum]
MARFQHTVTLAPVPRQWFESCVTTLHDVAEDLDSDGGCLRLPDGRPLPGLVLSEGSHLRPGARYRPVNGKDGQPDADRAATVLAWDRRRETALEVVTVDEDPAHPARLTCVLRLLSAARPREAWLTATLGTTGGKRAEYLGGTVRLHLDLGRWWPSAAGRNRRPLAAPLGGTLTHALARATVTVVPRPAPDGRWRVTVKARVRGRSLVRPLLPVVMAFMGRRAHRSIAEALDGAAREWNARLPALVHKEGEELRAELTGGLLPPRDVHPPRALPGDTPLGCPE